MPYQSSGLPWNFWRSMPACRVEPSLISTILRIYTSLYFCFCLGDPCRIVRNPAHLARNIMMMEVSHFSSKSLWTWRYQAWTAHEIEDDRRWLLHNPALGVVATSQEGPGRATKETLTWSPCIFSWDHGDQDGYRKEWLTTKGFRPCK